MLGQAHRSRVMQEYWQPRNALARYKHLLRSIIRPGVTVLHAGCGWDKNDVTRPYAASNVIIGVDIDPRVAHRFHSAFCLASLTALPFQTASFDLVCSEYVFEHLEDPGAALSEISRVLVPGGAALILTPNLYSYKTIVANVTPYRFHLALGRVRYGPGHEPDMYPTRYRCNSASRFHSLATSAGLAVRTVEFVSNGPTWFEKFPVLFELGHAFHVLTDQSEMMGPLRCNLVVWVEKPIRSARRDEPLAAGKRE
ncbi:MAG TPA: class I SAM-dependent methyltransferase [bacterium]|jgi:ubiquinone/menaquinone biosynthesis C-methylase UbiE